MYKIALFLALGVALAQGLSLPQQTRGVVNFKRCGGNGTPVQLRISDCEGTCEFVPGKVYRCEYDFMPFGATPSLTLKVEVCMSSGFCLQIIYVELPGSSVQPGAVYTAKYDFVPNDILAGETIEFRASLMHTDDLHLEVCAAAEAKVAYPVG